MVAAQAFSSYENNNNKYSSTSQGLVLQYSSPISNGKASSKVGYLANSRGVQPVEKSTIVKKATHTETFFFSNDV
jgi:hypothetical protein